MAAADFYDDNLNRSWPFVVGTVGVSTPETGVFTMRELPDEAVVDAGFVIGSDVSFDPSVDQIFLHSITRVDATTAAVVLASSCQDLASESYSLTVEGVTADSRFQTVFFESDLPFEGSESSSSSSLFPSYTPCGNPFWMGYVVFGRLYDVLARLSDGQTITRQDGDAVFYGTTVQTTAGHVVTSINVANKDRTRAVRPSKCQPAVWSFPVGEIYVVEQCITGDVVLRPGFNSYFVQPTAKSLQLSATLNAGLGQPCNEIPLFENESGPTNVDTDSLGGDFYCGDVLRSVSGIGGPDFNFLADRGVSVIGDDDNNTVIIDVDLNGISTFEYSEFSESV